MESECIMVSKTVMGAALVAAALSISQPASANVAQSTAAIRSQESAVAWVQPVYYRRHVQPGWGYGHRHWGGVYRPYAYGAYGAYPGYYPGYSSGYYPGWGYPAGYGYGWGPGVSIGIGPGFGIGFGF
jgi:hypothetical protein